MMKRTVQIVESYIDSHQEGTIALLKEMVQQPSVQGHEKGVQEVVMKKLRSLNLEIDVWDPSATELQSNPYYIASRNTYEGSPNVVGVLKGTGGGRSIILNGHIDVVPEGDLTQWTQPPFSGHVEGGKMFGRGTTDMKGGNAALILAMESIIRSGIKLKGDVIFESVVEEESGGVGSLATVVRGYTADAALIPEPTKMKLFIKQQGSMWFRVAVEGRSAHGGTRYEGVSAIEKAWKIHEAILQLEQKRNATVDDPLYKQIPIPLPINVGKVVGGSWPSSVADLVTMEGRIGIGPHEEVDEVKQQLVDCINRANANDDWLRMHPASVQFFGGIWQPNHVADDHPFVGVLSDEFKQVYGKPITIEASPWGTDAGMLGKAGNIPALVIGPGETKMAHYPNEYIDLNEMILASKLFARTILSWCQLANE